MLHVKVSRGPEPRAVCFDLENRPLAYWYDGQTTSEITAFGWKWADEKQVHTMLLRPDDRFVYWADKDGNEGDVLTNTEAYEFFVLELSRAGNVYGHNIRRHDLPMLNAALVRRQMPILPPMRTTDTCRDLPRTAGVSKSLENMAAMYGLKGDKLKMSQPMWEDANRLTDGGVALARKRVSSDVVLQERLRKKLLDLGILKEPRAWRP